MIVSELLQKLRAELEKRSIYDLRQIGRAAGVKRPADMRKDLLVGCIMDIAEGKTQPVPRSTKGAPPKSEFFDKDVVALIEQCRNSAGGEQLSFEQKSEEQPEERREMEVRADYEENYENV